MSKINKVYSIWLQQVLGYASCKVEPIINEFSTAENFYKEARLQKTYSKVLDGKILQKAKDVSLASAEKVLKNCDDLNINVISIEEEQYPKALKEIYNPPMVLYTKGKQLNLENNISISLVGSREASDYGKETAFNLSYKLAKCGINIISGGALGIDTMALKGAISAKSSNIIAVVATGLDVYYPKVNEKLYKFLENHGTIISEFPPSTTARPGFFPIRNRIMSGISQGVIIVEAAIKSGAIITANLALEQGREIFAVPGNINNPYSRGTNLLIKDGATPVTDVKDILEVYGISEKNKVNNFKLNNNEKIEANDLITKEPEGISLNAKRLYNVITQTPDFIDELAKKAKLDIINAQAAAMELLIIKAIKSHSGGRYSK